MDIKEKEKIFEASCKKLLAKDVEELNKSIDTEIEKQIKDEVQEFEKKEEFVYQKKQEKLEKDFNKQIYALEMEAEKEILRQKKNIRKNLKKEIEEVMRNFTKEIAYKDVLFRRINEALEKVKWQEDLILRIVDEDNQRYGAEIREKYPFHIEIMDNKYIGGCILEDKINGVYIDNTLQNSICEKLEKESR